MTTSVPIGEFSRLTHLTIKTLRHYHDLGLLVPHTIDEQSGYRRYAVDQVPSALLIGRLRELDMPLAEVRRVVAAPSADDRNAAIADHLTRMERELDRTRDIVASLRRLLVPTSTLRVSYRDIPSFRAVSISARVARSDIAAWCDQAFTELYTAALGGVPPDGPGAATYGEEFFTKAIGDVTAYVPIASDGLTERPPTIIPGGRFAIATHAGAFVDFDKTYGALGSYVAEHHAGAPGPIREIYLVGPPETLDEANFRTEVCWPIAA